MAEYSEADRQQAQRYVEALLGDSDASTGELEQGFSIADVQRHARQFIAELEFVDRIGEKFPTISIGDGVRIPVSLSTYSGIDLIGHDLYFGLSRSPSSLLYDLFYSFRRDPHREFEFVQTESARKYFISGATDFLATRLSAVRNWFHSESGRSTPHGGPPPSQLTFPPRNGRPPTSVPGCFFSVFSNTQMLSAYWSGAYYLSSNYFCHPTSPAQSILQAGTYIFGVNGGAYGNNIQWGTQSVCSLPGNSSVHLNY